MDYFDDLNPYLVKEDDNENLTIITKLFPYSTRRTNIR